jgi:hypothetical protein
MVATYVWDIVGGGNPHEPIHAEIYAADDATHSISQRTEAG